MRRALVLAVSLLPAVALADKITLTEDPPPAAAPKAGDVTGTLTPPADVADLRAVSRVTGKDYRPHSFDRKTGRFVFKALPGAARYDLCFAARDGRRIEGIDLDFVDQRMVRLAAQRRKQLGLPPERTAVFGPGDVKKLVGFIAAMKDFMEIRRVLYIKGSGIRATMLVELMRTRDFYSRKGSEVIWRVELWYFKNHFGGWDRLANQERVLRRVRVDREKWQEISVEYFPQLSAAISAEGTSAPVVFNVPPKGDPSRGRLAKTAPEQKTAPNILGLPAAAPPIAKPPKGDKPDPPAKRE